MDNVQSVEPVSIPDGDYRGTWGGYVVTIPFDDSDIVFEVDMGIRGMNVPVNITVYEGYAYIFQS